MAAGPSAKVAGVNLRPGWSRTPGLSGDVLGRPGNVFNTEDKAVLREVLAPMNVLSDFRRCRPHAPSAWCCLNAPGSRPGAL